jgi:hypothetical protein
MPQMPPSIDVTNDTTMKAFADAYRGAAFQGADFLATTATYLHPRMVNTLRKYGLDGTNRFGYGSDAIKSANKVVNLLKRAAEHLVDSGQCVGYAYQAFMSEVWEPAQRAKAEQKNHAQSTLDV